MVTLALTSSYHLASSSHVCNDALRLYISEAITCCDTITGNPYIKLSPKEFWASNPYLEGGSASQGQKRAHSSRQSRSESGSDDEGGTGTKTRKQRKKEAKVTRALLAHNNISESKYQSLSDKGQAPELKPLPKGKDQGRGRGRARGQGRGSGRGNGRGSGRGRGGRGQPQKKEKTTVCQCTGCEYAWSDRTGQDHADICMRCRAVAGRERGGHYDHKDGRKMNLTNNPLKKANRTAIDEAKEELREEFYQPQGYHQQGSYPQGGHQGQYPQGSHQGYPQGPPQGGYQGSYPQGPPQGQPQGGYSGQSHPQYQGYSAGRMHQHATQPDPRYGSHSHPGPSPHTQFYANSGGVHHAPQHDQQGDDSYSQGSRSRQHSQSDPYSFYV